MQYQQLIFRDQSGSDNADDNDDHLRISLFTVYEYNGFCPLSENIEHVCTHILQYLKYISRAQLNSCFR